MLIGYACTSIDDQYLERQREELMASGCERVFEDTASDANVERAGLTALLSAVCKGDTVVIWRLDRLGHSLKDLIRLAGLLETLGVGLRSVQDGIDTDVPGGHQVFHLLTALAEFEYNVSRERAEAGRAPKVGRQNSGRKKRLDPAQQEQALSLYHEGKQTVAKISRSMGIARSTFYRYLKEAQDSARRMPRIKRLGLTTKANQ